MPSCGRQPHGWEGVSWLSPKLAGSLAAGAPRQPEGGSRAPNLTNTVPPEGTVPEGVGGRGLELGPPAAPPWPEHAGQIPCGSPRCRGAAQRQHSHPKMPRTTSATHGPPSTSTCPCGEHVTHSTGTPQLLAPALPSARPSTASAWRPHRDLTQPRGHTPDPAARPQRDPLASLVRAPRAPAAGEGRGLPQAQPGWQQRLWQEPCHLGRVPAPDRWDREASEGPGPSVPATHAGLAGGTACVSRG